VAPLVGFTLETLLLAPPAIAYLAYLAAQGGMALPHESPGVKALVVGAGVITAAPLICFTSAARRLPLSTLGFFQYLAPSISFLLAVWLYGEPFGRTQAVAFACVWAALAVFTIASRRALGASGGSAPAAVRAR